MQTQFGVKIEIQSANHTAKKNSLYYELWMQKCSFKSSFFRHEIIKLPDKIIMENCLFVSKSINFDLPPIFNHWFTFSSDSHSYETSGSSKGLLKAKTVNTKKYGREGMTNNAVSSWNNIQKIFPSHVLRDLSYSRLKSLLVKYFLKSYSNNA